MSGDAAPLALPLSRLSAGACEATTLYRELRKPLLRYLVCLGLSSDEAQDVVQDARIFGDEIDQTIRKSSDQLVLLRVELALRKTGYFTNLNLSTRRPISVSAT